MFTLEKLNVVRLVKTERERDKLLHEGFKEMIKEVTEKEVQKIEKVIIKKSKGKE
jgi:hypothetical protein